MVFRFYNDNSYVYIDSNSKNVEYCGKNFSITKEYLISEKVGKIETDTHVLKWSNGELYLYDKISSISLLEILRYNETKNREFGLFSTFNKNETNDTSNLNQTFYLTKDTFINFYKKENGNFYIKFDEKESVVEKIYKVGTYTVYEASNGNILQLCNKKPCKFNNNIISKK